MVDQPFNNRIHSMYKRYDKLSKLSRGVAAPLIPKGFSISFIGRNEKFAQIFYLNSNEYKSAN